MVFRRELCKICFYLKYLNLKYFYSILNWFVKEILLIYYDFILLKFQKKFYKYNYIYDDKNKL